MPFGMYIRTHRVLLVPHLLLFLLFIGAVIPSLARQNEGWRPRVAWGGDETRTDVNVNGMTVMVFRPKPSSVTVMEEDVFRPLFQPISTIERAILVTDRLNQSLTRGVRSDSVRVDAQTQPDVPRVKVNGIMITSVSADAIPSTVKGKARKRSLEVARAKAESQAEAWASNLRRALAIPGLTLQGDTTRLIPMGEMRTIALGGAAQGAINLVTGMSGAAGIVNATVDETRGMIRLTAIRPGRDVITVEREGATVRINAVVKSYAASLQTPRPVEVTGAVVPASRIAPLALAAARNAITLTPGARVVFPEDGFQVNALGAGQIQNVSVPVRISGADLLTVDRKIQVPVINRPVASSGVATLLYSNDPERVKRSQRLFFARLPEPQEGAARLLYHHQNGSSKALRFTVELQNESDAPARVLFTGGDAGPALDTIWVGYRAGADFVDAQENRVGVTLELPPHSRMAIRDVRFPDELTISGLMQFRTLSGPSPLIKITAPEAGTPPETTFLASPLTPQRIAASPTPPASLSPHIYSNPLEKVKAEYAVGGRWTFVAFGKKPRPSAISPEKATLYGDYGVSYEIAVRMTNPTSQAATARVVFEPSAGYARGVFLVGNRRVEVPLTNMPAETPLGSFHLAPGETRDVQIRTIPLSGGNYPATLIVRP